DVVEVVPIDLSSKHHSHDVKTCRLVELGAHEQPAQHLQIRHRYHQLAIGRKNPVQSGECRHHVGMGDVFEDMTAVDHIERRIGELTQILDIADIVDTFSRLDVQDLPAGLYLLATDVQALRAIFRCHYQSTCNATLCRPAFDGHEV